VPPAGPRADPFGAFDFRVEIDGIALAAFMEVSGLESETTVIEYRTGDSQTLAKLPGLTRYANIVLRRGITVDKSLWQWRQEVVAGKNARRDGAIVLLDEAGQALAAWNFRNGWPCRWEGPRLRAGRSRVAIETLELAHEGIEYEVR
jgi:phage tail-like protein